jgi:adenylate kinase
MISSSSIISGCPFYIIQNNTDEIEKASSDICKVILSK